MQLKPKFVGFVEKPEMETIEQLIDNNWQTDLFGTPPLSALTPSNSYLLTLGSGIYPSMATTNPQGLEYFAGFDLFRSDFDSKNVYEPLVNIDHYIISLEKYRPNTFPIFKIPSPNVGYHWPKLHDPIIQELPKPWKFAIEDLLKKKPSSL